MAMYESKTMIRKGNVFRPERGDIEYDLSDLRVLDCGVDTIRQIYTCDLDLNIITKLEKHFEISASRFIEVGGIDWIFSKSGSKSGYQYILKNLDLGFVVLVKSFYAESDVRASHIKIEVTPKFIDEHGLSVVSNKCREIANIFASTVEAKSVACHLFVDVKGLSVPENFDQKLVTRSKRNMTVKGIGSMSSVNSSAFDVAQVQYTYNSGDTFLFGRANQLQFCLYNKTLEAIKSDNLAWHESRWVRTPSCDPDRFPEPEYNNGSVDGIPDTVHRLEFRFHHSVIEQFEHGNFNATNNLVCIREAKDLVKHLDGLFQYALNNFRLHHSSTYIHPIWQLLMTDVSFARCVHKEFIYKRAKKKSDSPSSRRNVACLIGNYLRLVARIGVDPVEVTNNILNLGLGSELLDYFDLNCYDEEDLLFLVLLDFVQGRMKEHSLNGVAA